MFTREEKKLLFLSHTEYQTGRITIDIEVDINKDLVSIAMAADAKSAITRSRYEDSSSVSDIEIQKLFDCILLQINCLLNHHRYVSLEIAVNDNSNSNLLIKDLSDQEINKILELAKQRIFTIVNTARSNHADKKSTCFLQ